MKKGNRYKVFVLVCCLLSARELLAEQQPVEMADAMRSNGKIYIVVAVCLTILVGLFLFVWRLDRKITRMEKSGERE